MKVRDKILIAVILALILAIGLIVCLREGGGPSNRERSAFLNIKVAVQYRYVTDGGVMNRSVDDVIEIFKGSRSRLHLPRLDDPEALSR